MVLLTPFVVSAALIFLPSNPIYPGIIAMGAGSVAACYCRPDLKRKTWIGGLLFLAYYVIFLQGLQISAPGYTPLGLEEEVISKQQTTNA